MVAERPRFIGFRITEGPDGKFAYWLRKKPGLAKI
jgi:hypothetical protein